MLVTTRFRVDAHEREAFVADAGPALAALGGRPGCLLLRLGQAVDDPQLWALTGVWESVGAYRRALSHYDVKLHTVPFLHRALDEPSAFDEVLLVGEGARGRADGHEGSRTLPGGVVQLPATVEDGPGR